LEKIGRIFVDSESEQKRIRADLLEVEDALTRGPTRQEKKEKEKEKRKRRCGLAAAGPGGD
jgi:hypothetical protein